MGIFASIVREFTALFGPTPTLLEVMESGNVVKILPDKQAKRPVKQKTQDKKEKEDAYIIDESTALFGFVNESSKSVRADRKGACRELTAVDIEFLMEAEYWSDAPTAKAKKQRAATELTKSLWFDGEEIDFISARIGLSKSWVEKRVGIFGRSLAQ
jgi:hypothetical protein